MKALYIEVMIVHMWINELELNMEMLILIFIAVIACLTYGDIMVWIKFAKKPIPSDLQGSFGTK